MKIMNKISHQSITFWILILILCPILMQGQTKEHHIFSGMANDLFLGVSVVVIFAALWSLYRMMIMYFDRRAEEMMHERGLEISPPQKSTGIFEWLKSRAIDRVPVEKEHTIMMDHEYDGIHELDNNLPPWWLWLFYLSIAYSVVYVYVYHFSPWRESSIQQYEYEMAKAEEEVELYLALKGENIDENNLEVITDVEQLKLAQATFVNLCATCHRPDGGGSVGPNLTDPYWLHGGDIGSIYKTIKYGVPEKGMISWSSQLSPKKMHQLASYIMTLKGNEVPEPKAPQGILEEEIEEKE